MATKKLPLGCEDFKKAITNNYYYADKTGLIKNLIDNEPQVTLFTRPRRFGKTLNQSMLKYFFEKTEEDHSILFDGLEIAGSDGEYMKEQGQYPVIFVSFKDLKQNSYDETYNMFKIIISKEFNRHLNILNSSAISATDKELFERIVGYSASLAEYKFAIGFLSDCLYRVYNQKVIILIDEYDVPLENAYFCGFYNEMVDLIRTCFSVALKTNNSLKFAVLTGCLRISKESIFTGFNNFTVYGVQNAAYSTYFGFTDKDVADLLEYYGICDSRDEVREWYDGYIFGKTEMYNPYSLVNYVSNRIAGDDIPAISYWSNTSSNTVIRALVSKCNDETREDLEKLMHGESITKSIYEDLTYGDLENGENSEQIWSHLLFTGYLKQCYNPEKKMYDLRIPNHEVMTTYTKIIQDAFKKKVDSTSRDDLFRAILDMDEETVNLIINDWLYDSISYHDENESFYHGTIFGMLSGFRGYILESNREAGDGRFDLMLYDKRRRSVGICFEFKIADNSEQIETKIEEALKQIQEKDYTQFFRKLDITNIIRYGVVFCNKRCKLKAQKSE